MEWLSDESGVGKPISTFPKESMTFWPIFPIILPDVAFSLPSCSTTGSSCSNSGKPLVADLFCPYLPNSRMDRPEIFWACFHHPYSPPHKTMLANGCTDLEKKIKMVVGCWGWLLKNCTLEFVEISRVCYGHPYASPHETNLQMDAWISWKFKNACRWWKSISRKLCTRICWNFLGILLSSICISP